MKQYDYSKNARYYDIIELGCGEGPITSEFLSRILKKYDVQNILDFTCGTGSQAIGLAEKGYKITASDINKDMLRIAKEKAKSKRLKIKFLKGDMRKSHLGKFDAVITMFNAIGHLDRKDFEKTVRNILTNLRKDGLFILDIFNLDFMKSGGFAKDKFIDVALEKEDMKFVRFNKNKIDVKKGVLRINQETFIQKGMKKPRVLKDVWDMKIYSSDELRKILENNNFEVVKIYGLGGKRFIKNKSLHIMVVSRKIQ